MELPDASGSSFKSRRSLIRSSLCLLGLVLGATACMQPPTQITVNANSSADKTTTNTENYSSQIDSKESSSLVDTQAPSLSPARTPDETVTPYSMVKNTQIEKGLCSFNNKSMPCTVMQADNQMTMIWSDGVTETYSNQGNGLFIDIPGGKWLNIGRGANLLLEHKNGNKITFVQSLN